MRHLLLASAVMVLPIGAAAQDSDETLLLNTCRNVTVGPGQTVCFDGEVFSDDEIVAVGNRHDASTLDKLTSPASVLTRLELERRNEGSLADALRAIPSLSVSASGPGFGLTQLRLRGSEANHVVVLIDGVEVANPTDGAFDFGGLSGEDILRVEVLRGEQSALYGSDAIGGVINIITDTSEAREHWQGSVEYGARDSFEAGLSAGIPIGPATLSVSGTAFETDGYDISGLGDEKDTAQGRNLRLGLNQLSIGRLDLSAQYGFTTRTTAFDEDANFDGRLDNTDSASVVETTTARLGARTDLAGWNLSAALSRLETETDTRAGFSSLSEGVREQTTLTANREFGSHQLTILGEYELEEYRFDGDPDTPSNDTYGLAADYNVNLNNWTWTASLRHDANDLFDDATTWRAGLGYDTGAFGRLTASAGTGVKNPTLIELFGFFPAARFIGNPDLKPEESFGYNLGWAKTTDRGRIAVNYFRSELEDEIITIFNPDFTTGVANLDTDSTREGLEIEARYGWDQLSVRGSISILDSEQNGVEEIRRPDFLASGTVTWTPTNALSVSVIADHTGEQLDTDFATFSTVTLDAFTRVGANVSYQLNEPLSVYVRGENLLDEDYEEVVGYRSPGAALFAGLRASY